MARYIGPLEKLSRREGINLYLKGKRSYTEKSALRKRNYVPGQHGRQKQKLTQYAMQLRSKQALKRMYGLMERQFRNTFEEAERSRSGETGEVLMQLLERRLDSVVYQMGFAPNRRTARQIVTHGHILVNGKKVNIPSYRVKVGDVIEVKEKSRNIQQVREGLELVQEGYRNIPNWLNVEIENFRGTFQRLPKIDEMDVPVPLTNIIELYSK
ncbi:RNA-binding S4 domain protein [Petrotoga mobilis SJ95]|uniref:Small ribosomal subunit protein uS4 n=1 Tax=Petrotoga mobilis (strain DSM 10674 / SJ95) TaxID=403833 RepID=RS4_PETMO|nr:30S ribosomal protein S4 [Petrotoga mobilis]A9BFZ1.1 RecName: Full=Small ribosomal subunit protein uS4; AltName: Full=30S ribosomal protein S4 [Petrotoga mobilis SJ95]ABX31487.1 RNA-binding S4 domain protein [Petrotoga mobilis SJ95]